MPYSLERFIRIYDDKSGEYWEIRPDSDGLGCVEIRYNANQRIEDKSEIMLTVTPELAQLVANAMITTAGHIKKPG